MTTTRPNSGDDLARFHRAALRARQTKRAAILYACEQFHDPTPREVQNWLERHGYPVGRTSVWQAFKERTAGEREGPMDVDVAANERVGAVPLFATANEHGSDQTEQTQGERTVFVPDENASIANVDPNGIAGGGPDWGSGELFAGGDANDSVNDADESEQRPSALNNSADGAPTGRMAAYDAEHAVQSAAATVPERPRLSERGRSNEQRTERTNEQRNPHGLFSTEANVGIGDRATPPGALGFYVVAVLSLFVSLDTSWLFFGQRLGIENAWVRGGMFAVVEAALIACGYGMVASIRDHGKPGPARLVAWTLCGVAAYMALALSGPVEGVARVALGPGLGLVMLHLALGLEVRAQRARSGTWARIGREIRERVLSRVGLADDDRNAAQRTRERAARRIAKLSLGRRVMFRETRLARSAATAQIATDAVQLEVMLAELATRRSLLKLAQLEQTPPWG